MQWLYGNQHSGNNFGYGKGVGPRSCTVTGLTKNVGSEKRKPSLGSYNYIDVMRELKKQSSKKVNTIQFDDQTYNIKNPSHQKAIQLQFKLAEQIYDSIRECDTDISDISRNIGFKADNIKNLKDHIFYSEHDLDRYGPDTMEHILQMILLGLNMNTRNDITN